MLETRICSKHCHKSYGSIYPKEKVPIELFQDPLKKELYKSCYDCRAYGRIHHKRKLSPEQSIDIEKENTQECTATYHKLTDSKYPREYVPIDSFKNIENIDKPYKRCIDCRDYDKNISRKTREKKNLLLQTARENDLEFLYCFRPIHNKINVSNYPRDRVPKSLFLKESETGEMYKTCQDCRTYRQNDFKNKEQVIKDRNKMKEYNKLLKKEQIEKYQSCCNNCKCIFLYNEKNNSIDVFQTYMVNDERYVTINDIIYLSKEAIEVYKDQLEYCILEFDHLTEIEQRERGILLPNDPYIGKINDVSQMSGKNSMRAESLKCQLLCSKCHILNTMKREKGLPKSSLVEKRRLDYVRPIKLKGCVNCGFSDPNLLRFLEFDHLDKSTKIIGICEMIQLSKYTDQEFIEEIEKCRVLCRWCHSLHTRIQRKIS